MRLAEKVRKIRSEDRRKKEDAKLEALRAEQERRNKEILKYKDEIISKFEDYIEHSINQQLFSDECIIHFRIKNEKDLQPDILKDALFDYISQDLGFAMKPSKRIPEQFSNNREWYAYVDYEHLPWYKFKNPKITHYNFVISLQLDL